MLSGGGPGPYVVFIPLLLELGLLGHHRRLSIGSSIVVTIDRGCGTKEAWVSWRLRFWKASEADAPTSVSSGE